MAIKTFGTIVTVNDATVGGLLSAEFSGADVNMIDTTTHDQEDACREFVGGLTDSGSLELTGNLLPDDEGQVEMESEVGKVAQIEVSYIDGTSISFDAVIGAVNLSSDLDSKVEFTRSLKISGKRTITAGEAPTPPSE
jgi:hypothetical protein